MNHLVGSPDVTRVSLSELEVGKIFDSSELVIHRDRCSMDTIRHEEGFFNNGEEYDIRLFHYDIFPQERGFAMVSYNGYTEVLRQDKEYQGYRKNLEEKGLW